MSELDKLIEGNKRYVEGNVSPKDYKAKREETKESQKPFCTIVSCSDSRVVPEFIFDVNLGEIFVIRTAGNIVDTITLGSIEYAVEHLETPLLVILGHEKCGAITAACSGGECSPNIAAIVEKLEYAIEMGGKDVERSVKNNIKHVITQIKRRSELVRSKEKEGKLKIVGLEYFLSDGHTEKVE
jgi:carbonic anhydrase